MQDGLLEFMNFTNNLYQRGGDGGAAAAVTAGDGDGLWWYRISYICNAEQKRIVFIR